MPGNIPVWSALQKYATKGGHFYGNLLEVGPGFGKLLAELFKHTSNSPNFSVSAIEKDPNIRQLVPVEARSRCTLGDIYTGEGITEELRESQHTIVAKQVFNSPGVTREMYPMMLRNIAFMLRKKGVAIIQVARASQMPSREEIKNAGFWVEEADKGSGHFLLVLRKKGKV